jgi:hypothetical protein
VAMEGDFGGEVWRGRADDGHAGRGNFLKMAGRSVNYGETEAILAPHGRYLSGRHDTGMYACKVSTVGGARNSSDRRCLSRLGHTCEERVKSKATNYLQGAVRDID